MNKITLDKCELTAFKILYFISKDTARIKKFFAVTGINPQNVKEVSKDENFYKVILYYIINDEKLLIAYCEAEEEEPNNIIEYYNLVVTEPEDKLQLGSKR